MLPTSKTLLCEISFGQYTQLSTFPKVYQVHAEKLLTVQHKFMPVFINRHRAPNDDTMKKTGQGIGTSGDGT